MDDGYMDMYEIVQALQDIGFDGAIMSDHLPQMVGGAHAAEAYGVAYMKALVNAAQSQDRIRELAGER
jgi:mannonate dehydratase